MPPSPPSSQLPAHAVLFGRELRRAGANVTSGQIARFVEALAHIDVSDPVSFRDAARATLTSSREEAALFEQIFDRFWHRERGGAAHELVPKVAVPSARPMPAEIAIAKRLGQLRDETPQALVDRSMTWSRSEVLRHKRFDTLDEAETAGVLRLMARAWPPLPHRRTRRYRPASRGRTIDWRQTVRAAIRERGALIERRWRRRTHKPRPLVILADVSGSMERYSRMLLQYLHVLVQRSRQTPRPWPIEVFAFGTRLTRITRALRVRDSGAVAAAVSQQVVDWSGGTRIGESLHAFNRTWGRQVLARGAIVVIISDGWDRGRPDLVGREMAWLRRRGRRLYWLNPLVGTRGYAPESAGLVAALPFVDRMLGAGDLASLETALRTIATSDARSPSPTTREPD